jgi:3-oxoacyl-(acyl-carrier-protein) synthase/acyl carrier protein
MKISISPLNGYNIMRYLFFLPTIEEAEGIASTFSENDTVISIIPGNSFSRINKNIFQIRQHESVDFQRLLETNDDLPERVLYAWSWSRSIMFDDISSETNLTSYVDSAFLLLQAILKANPIHSVYFIFTNTFNSDSIPIYPAFGAITRSVSHESRKLVCKQVMFLTDREISLCDQMPILMYEYNEHLLDKEVRYKEGQRQHRILKEVEATTNTQVNLPIKQGGTYIITGGTGVLGGIVAKHIASLYQITLILVGRKPLNKTIKEKIDELTFLGANCAYYSIDISNREAVSDFIDNAIKQHGSINGIFHAAGLVRDSRIIYKPLSDFQEVQLPKIYGTINLDYATQGQPLDFCVYFSSISAMLGNVGQSDYSYANSFLDHYAKFREALYHKGMRKGKTVSINWPLWADGGMKVDKEIEEFTERTFGLPPLDTENGLNLLQISMSSSHSQLLAVHGERSKISKLLGLTSTGNGIASRTVDRTNIDSTLRNSLAPGNQDNAINLVDSAIQGEIAEVNHGILLQQLQTSLIDGLIEILEVNPKDADIDTDLNRFGFDSITMTTFSNRLATELKIELTPVVFFEYQTVRELSEYIMEEHANDVRKWYKEKFNTPQQSSRLSAINGAQVKTDIPPVEHVKSNIDNSQEKSQSTSPPAPVQQFQPNHVDYEKDLEENAEPIAIIGVDGRLPQSMDLEIFWQHLLEGNNLITEIPEERWKWQKFWGEPFHNKNKTLVKWGGFVPEVEYFDAAFFGISRREAELMDPQHRLFLQAVWRCIEDAGYAVSKLVKNNIVGLFCGSASVDYHDLIADADIDIDVFAITGNMFSVLVNRISYLLDFRGPSEPVETACSSSLVSVHRAIQSIRAGECDLAIAGGVHLMLTPSVHIGLDKGGFLSQKGRCATFDEEADGYVRGEGCVALLLKPLRRAQADGDDIKAVILGSAVNHGGKVNTLTTPNPNAQTEVVVKAWKQAGVDPRTISCIEAHGTGTVLGDPIEVKALRNAFEMLYEDYGIMNYEVEKHCGLGSVKSNIGHLEFASGVSGMVKIIKAMHNEILPPSIHYNKLNPYIKLDNSPFYIIDTKREWIRPQIKSGEPSPLRAGVSSFGFGGVNCHIALEEYSSSNHLSAPDTGVNVVLISAKTTSALKVMVVKLKEYIRKNPVIKLSDIAYTLATGREHMTERLLFLVNSLGELNELLDEDTITQREGVVYTSNSKTERSILEFIKSREDAIRFEKKLIEKGVLSELATYWVAGLDINWENTAFVSGRRISLPTYPFEKTKYWVGSGMMESSTLSDTLDDSEINQNIDNDILELLNAKIIDKVEAEILQKEFNGALL